MRKFIYLILFCVASSITMFSCTEESIAPRQNTDAANGGGVSDDRH